MPGISMKPEVITEIQRQFNHELSAAHAYVALSVWCHDHNFKGFARFFSKQAAEEREHAQKFMQHLLDRGVTPALGAIPAPKNAFGNLVEIAAHARSMEQTNTVGIHACYAAALRVSDYPSQVMLQWFINEQVEEEAWTDEMVARVERANCAGGLAELDRHIARHLSDKGLSAAAAE